MQADLDVADYGATGGAASPQEQAQLARQIEAEQREAQRRFRAQAELAAAHAAAERMRREARPYAVRLLEARCTRCHVADYYQARGHTWFGWSMLTLRMKYLHGASDIRGAERARIVSHLAETLPASGSQAAIEYLAAAGVASLPPLAVWCLIGWRRRRIRGGADASHGLDGERI